MPRELSLLIRGAMHLNADGSNRMFEIAMMTPGDPVQLVLEPKNKHDPFAVAIHTVNGFHIGYIAAERCALIGSKIRNESSVVSIFQERTEDGGVIRVNLDGKTPTLPVPKPAPAAPHCDEYADPDYGFCPDYIPPDD